MENKANETPTPAAGEAVEDKRTETAGNGIENTTPEAAAESCGQENSEVCFSLGDIDNMMKIIEDKSRLLEEMSDRYKRLQADFENFRRRTRQEKEELSVMVTESVVLQFLPVVDNFERAIGSAAAQDAAAVRTGVEMIYRQMIQVFEKLGVAPIEAAGRQFDPQLHEAVLRVEDSEHPENTVVEELQKGYMFRGKVIRPSMVKVRG